MAAAVALPALPFRANLELDPRDSQAPARRRINRNSPTMTRTVCSGLDPVFRPI
jgi:hypothetical protein